MQFMRLLACAAAVTATGGCATIVRGADQDFVIESSPPGAEAILSTGESCVTPCTLRLPRKADFDVTFNLEDYQSGTVHVSSVLSRDARWAFAQNAALGAHIDVSTGAIRDLWPNPLTVTLLPIESETASGKASLDAPAAASPAP